MTLPLTDMFDKTFEQAYRMTAPGMAHLAGSGPDNRTCRECLSFYFDKGKPEYWASSNKSTPNGLKPARCAKYKALSQVEGQKFPNNMPACKHFEDNPAPPSQHSGWRR